ncbi:MAG: phosphotransferase, partial [Pirellulales bacterium]
VPPGQPEILRELTGGVSNKVLLLERPDVPQGDFVLKQAREKLRTAHDWFCSRERIWREADVLCHCSQLLEQAPDDGQAPPLIARTPDVLFEDREHYLLAISAAPRPNRVWKQDLLAGRVDPLVAMACGHLLGTLHGGSWQNARIADALGDRSLFEELRVDPYYRTLALARSEARVPIERLIASLEEHPRALVHADFSPKNMLLYHVGMLEGLMLVDFETGHYGDPAFDLGFFLSHLVLKACHHMPDHARYLQLTETFHRAYDQRIGQCIGSAELASLWSRGIQNFAGCAWARLDGKSPVDYLDDSQRRELIRELCREIFVSRPSTWEQAVRLASETFDKAARHESPAIQEESEP